MRTEQPIVEALRERTPEMVESLRELVDAESPTADIAATRSCADALAARGEALLGVGPSVIVRGGRTHLWWRSAGARVLLLGHLDTVWPLGTTARWPFAVRDGIATGPGVFDMKAGLVQGLFVLESLDSLDDVELLITSDEEIGSPTSRELIEEAGRRAEAVLVLEPSSHGALKVARKGCYTYRVTARGRASHAGLDPHAGANALTALAHHVLAVRKIEHGSTTVTPTVARAGTTANTVPDLATLTVDVRVPTQSEFERVDTAIRSLASGDGVEVAVELETGRPPLQRSASEGLFAQARLVGSTLGLGELEGVEVGGGSDGNFTAAVGTPTLDGLGAVGDGAHAEREHVVVEKMAERAALVAELVRELTR